MEPNDRFFLPRLQPKITGNPTIVFIDAPVALSPVVKLAGSHAQPVDKSPGTDLGLLRPASDEIHHLIPHIVWHPHLGQSSPRLFLTRCARPSVRPGPHPWSAPSSPRTRSVSVSPRPGGRGVPSIGRRRLRFRRTLFASDRTPSAVGPVPRRDRKPAPYPAGAVSGWRPSLLNRSAFVPFACVLSVYING